MNNIVDFNKFIQICVLVRDVHKTAENWARFLKIDMPPISMTEKYSVTHAIYKNEPCDGRIYQAIFDLNNIQLEIVGPVDGEPSVWREYLDKHGEGLHHLALYTKDIDRAIAEFSNDGIGVSQRGYWPAEPKDGAYAYLETYDALKCVVELLSF